METLILAPDDCTPQELAEFETLVQAGHAVGPEGLARRIQRAFRLLFLREAGGQLAGIAALKRPGAAYQEKNFRQAGLTPAPGEDCLELGWLVVAPAFHGRGLSRQIALKLAARIGSAPAFATVRADNTALQAILAKGGFTRAGRNFPAQDSGHELVLYVRHGGPPAPRILIVALDRRRSGIARLPRALQQAGFEVGAACFSDSHLAATRFRDHFFPWHAKLIYGDRFLRELRKITRTWPPDLLIPGDETTVLFLARVFQKISRTENPLAALLRRSLGNPAALLEAASKSRTLARAGQLGICVPRSEVIESGDRLDAFGRETGFPILLKRSFSWAGNGTLLCQDAAEALAGWKKWYRKPGWKQRFYAWRNSIRGRNLSLRWLPADTAITANQFVPGNLAMCLVTAFEGRVLAALTAKKEMHKPHDLNPSTVVRFIQNEEMRRIAGQLVSAWGLTGFIGFDFIINPDGAACLIECNPRPIPISHLGSRAGEDLCTALFCQLTSRPPPRARHTPDLLIAHFPQEKRRNPASPYLTGASHDIPHGDPKLMQRLTQTLPPG